jgi:hypothetical protein
VPSDLRVLLGKTEIVHTLQTSDPHVARQHAGRLDLEVQALFDAARTGVIGAKGGVSVARANQVIDNVCDRFERDAVLADRHERRRLRDVEAGDWNVDRGQIAEMLEDKYAAGGQPTEEAIAALKRHGATIPPEALNGLLFELQQLTIGARGLVERDRDAVAARGLPRPALPDVGGAVAEVNGGATTSPQPALTLAEAVAKYKAERIATKAWRAGTAKDTGARLDKIVVSFGGEREVGSITRDEIREWRDGLNVKTRTVRKRVQTVSALFEWLVDEGAVDKNPAKKLLPKEPSKTDPDRRCRTRGQTSAYCSTAPTPLSARPSLCSTGGHSSRCTRARGRAKFAR